MYRKERKKKKREEKKTSSNLQVKLKPNHDAISSFLSKIQQKQKIVKVENGWKKEGKQLKNTKNSKE